MIPIDRKSIRKNPNYGREYYIIYGPTILEVDFHSKLPISPEEDFGVGATIIYFSGAEQSGTLLLNDLSKFKDLQKLVNILRWENKTESKVVYGLGDEPKYLFDYHDFVVSCDSCGYSFNWRQLKSDSVGDIYSNTICPKCDTWDCCDLVFEKFTASLVEK